MKLKTNNKFSKWLYKLACKFGYSPWSPKPETVYIIPKPITSKNFIKLSCAVKVPESTYSEALNYTDKGNFINQEINRAIYHKFIENETFRQNIKLTSKFNLEDYTTTIYAELYILNKEGLEDFYERY
jgi:hypothetical protein